MCTNYKVIKFILIHALVTIIIILVQFTHLIDSIFKSMIIILRCN